MSRRSIRRMVRLRTAESDQLRESHAVFLRGLTLGALIGAAIAGSAIWERRRLREAAAETGPEPSVTAPDEAIPEPDE